MSFSIVRIRDDSSGGRRRNGLRRSRSALLAPAAAALAAGVELLERSRGAAAPHARCHGAPLTARAENQVGRQFPRLSGHDVDALIEVAWLMLITPVGLYPGWRDLMTATALQSSLHPRWGRRPGGGLLAAATSDRDLYEADSSPRRSPPSEADPAILAGPRGGGDRPRSDRIGFYDARGRAAHRPGRLRRDDNLVPAAFVTSMDVELEMSLVRRLSELAEADSEFDARFTVLVPYHFLYGPHGRDPRAMLFWLAATIDVRELDAGDEFDLRGRTSAGGTPRRCSRVARRASSWSGWSGRP